MKTANPNISIKRHRWTTITQKSFPILYAYYKTDKATVMVTVFL